MSTNEEKDTSLTAYSSEEEPHNPLAEMPPKVQRFLHLYMTGQYSITKLAQLLEVHPNTIHGWMKRTNVREAITDMQKMTHEVVGGQMKAMTMKAMDRMRELMDSPIDGVALQAVKDVLDRSGHKAKQEIKVDKTIRTFEEQLEELIEDVVDGEWEDIE